MKDGLTLTLTWKESIRGFGIYMLHEEKKAWAQYLGIGLVLEALFASYAILIIL